MTDETQTEDNELDLEDKLILIIEADIFAIALVLVYAAGYRDGARSLIDFASTDFGAPYFDPLTMRQAFDLPGWINPTVSVLTVILFVSCGTLLAEMWKNGTVEEAIENMREFGVDG